MKKTFILILLIMLTTGCQGLKRGLGLEKDVPDEFLIEKIDPIERPPNYDLLPPGSKIKTAKRKSNKNLKNIIDGDLKKNNTSKVTTPKSNEPNLIEDEILKELKHFKNKDKDYIVKISKKDIELLAINGSSRLGFKSQGEILSKNEIIIDNNNNLLFVNSLNKLLICNHDGNSSEISIESLDSSSSISYHKESNQLIFSNKNELFFLDNNFIKTNSIVFNEEIKKISTYEDYIIVNTKNEIILLKNYAIVKGTPLKFDGTCTVTNLSDNKKINIHDTSWYRGMMFSGIPNLFAHAGYINFSWTARCEIVSKRICKTIGYIKKNKLISCTPKYVGKASKPSIQANYVLRAMDKFPNKTYKFYQNYLIEYISFKYTKINDGALSFSKN